jgi:release factor glutamine methyltransferase
MNSYTVSSAINKASDILLSAGIENNYFEAGLIMEYCLNISREKMLEIFREHISEKTADKYFQIVDKRKNRYPLQYITGEQEFMGLTIKVNSHVLIPRRETEELVENILKSKININSRIVDVGTGSGAIAVSLKRFRPDLNIYAADISSEALKVAELNAENLKVKVNFLLGNTVDPLIEKNIKVDGLVSNPPYISNNDMHSLMPEVKFEPEMALRAGEDGLKYYREIADKSSEIFKEEGRIFLEIGYMQAKEVSEILSNAGFSNIKVYKDYQDRERIIKGNFYK